MSEFVNENRKFAKNRLMRNDSKRMEGLQGDIKRSNSSKRSNSKRSNSKRSNSSNSNFDNSNSSNSKIGDSNFDNSNTSDRKRSKSFQNSKSSRRRTISKRSSNSSAVKAFTRKRAQKTIGKFMKKAEQKRKADIARLEAVKAFTKNYTQKRARKTIGVFMKKTENKRRSKFLQAICSDSGVCIAFGKERKKIFDFFNGFTKFDYLKNIKAIGKVSANGFVKELEYEREGYKAHAILKSSRQKDADNLMYEYFVGNMINFMMLNNVPCFIETYGHYRYKKESDWIQFQDKNPGNVNLNAMLIPYKKGLIDYSESCRYSETLCVLVQHIKGAASIGDKVIKDPPDFDFIINDLLYSFYQVYYALATFVSVFTHYDLHPDNVILYKPVAGKYIEFHYHLPDGSIINFKSQYIVKIIDYGRCFLDKKGFNSVSYYDDICKKFGAPACNQDPEVCGDESGYGWLQPPLEEDAYYISSTLNNRSHDLRLLNDLKLQIPWHDEPFKSSTRIRNHMKYILLSVEYTGKYGTPPVVGKKDFKKTEDVTDAEAFIKRAVMDPEQKAANDDYYKGMGKLGDMHIYGDKPMEYIPA
jgi:hypothetical protein